VSTNASSSGRTMDRREFLHVVGGGIIVFIAASDLALLEELAAAELPQQRGYPTDFNAYLRIGEDGRITVFSGKIEMGQGIITSLAQMAAEELGVDIAAVDMVMGDTASCPWDAGTWGSLSTRVFGPALRAAAAAAREVLIDLAAERLDVPADHLEVRDGAVVVRDGAVPGRDAAARARDAAAVRAGAVPARDAGRRVTFGELAAGRRIERVLGREAVLRAVREFTVMGRSYPRTDGEAKVTGATLYTGDIRVPGMLRARLLRPPAHGATLRSVDTVRAREVPDIVVVEEAGLVAVLHEDIEQAERALRLVRAEWDEPETTVDDVAIHDHLVARLARGSVQHEAGSMDAGAAAATHVFEHTYLDNYVAHAPIETHTALAIVENASATLWISTQTPFGDQQRVAAALGLPVEAVRVITPQVGGGFGGKASSGQAIEAARLARATGRPVQVMWTRQEEFFYDTFRPAAVVKIRSGIDAAGTIPLWDYRVYAAGTRGADMFYESPHRRITAHNPTADTGAVHPFATGPWRAPGANTNTFARESQVDIMAAHAGIDPLEFRLRNMQEPRIRSALEAAAERFGWTPAPGPSGRGYGIACGVDAGTWVAHIAEVDVADDGMVTVRRVVCAQEMGIVVNPEGAILQVEGCITMGLGYALAEKVRFQPNSSRTTHTASMAVKSAMRPHRDGVARLLDVDGAEVDRDHVERRLGRAEHDGGHLHEDVSPPRTG
jgi:nicotinate dehydrogenase subunit B